MNLNLAYSFWQQIFIDLNILLDDSTIHRRDLMKPEILFNNVL